MGFSESIAAAIHSLDEHWDGGGYPDGLREEQIPLFSRIMNLAQTLAVFWTAHGASAALSVIEKRAMRWFDPDLVKAAVSLASSGGLWRGLDARTFQRRRWNLEPEERRLTVVRTCSRVSVWHLPK